jgi:hypothetical protein
MAPSASPVGSKSSPRLHPPVIPGRPIDAGEPTPPDRTSTTPPAADSLDPDWVTAIDSATD